MAAEKKPEKQIDAYMESMKAYQKTYEFLFIYLSNIGTISKV